MLANSFQTSRIRAPREMHNIGEGRLLQLFVVREIIRVKVGLPRVTGIDPIMLNETPVCSVSSWTWEEIQHGMGDTKGEELENAPTLDKKHRMIHKSFHRSLLKTARFRIEVKFHFLVRLHSLRWRRIHFRLFLDV